MIILNNFSVLILFLILFLSLRGAIALIFTGTFLLETVAFSFLVLE
jgi:hypothetical protein